MQSASPALIFDKVCFSYPTSHSPVINIEKWQIERGQHVFVSGQSGSGKSTLLNLICGTLTPNSGEITLLGESFSSRSSSQRDAFRGKHIGVVFQQFNLIPYLTVHDNIKAAAYFGNSVQKDFEAKVSYFIETLQLPKDTLARRADSLSVGQQQRVAIARSLINSPEILVVDEPTSALDSDARDRFMQLLFECVEKTQSTLLFVSHDKSLAHFFSSTIDINTLSNSVSHP